MSTPSAPRANPDRPGGPRPAPAHEDLLEHLSRTTALGPSEAARVVADVLAYFSESPEEFVRRRHGELQARGLTNDRIFERVALELPQRRFRAAEFSSRQLRRIVYG
ncbi:hypothetical protein GXW82_20415 [Streptacidiphilus sp. 4-A2]|nr:hypothetical protein [Streptacidiphilus sp. 4-A2]